MVICGLGSLAQVQSNNEFVSVEQTIQASKMYLLVSAGITILALDTSRSQIWFFESKQPASREVRSIQELYTKSKSWRIINEDR